MANDITRRSLFFGAAAALASELPRDDGYRGIWYFNQPTKDAFKYKYSGGFATYPQQHAPIAIYSKAAAKTFFCYGGTVKGKQELLHMVSYFDHKTRTVPRPVILLNKQTEDAHDNPTISIDAAGHIWIFSSAHGTSRPSFIHRSRAPFSIDDFELIEKTNFSYTQPWYFDGDGFVFLHTRYSQSRRALYSMSSADGRKWSEPRELALALKGHYQISWPDTARRRLATAFDIHPEPLGLNQRTNIYYMETRDGGRTWINVQGKQVELPIRSEHNAALVRDYHAEGLLVYLKDLHFDSEGHPLIAYLTSKGYEPGPEFGPRVLRTARWTGAEWRYSTIGNTDHNYDHGSLFLEGTTWRFIGPTGAGPQPFGTGGEIELWESHDDARTWRRVRALTRKSKFNHTYVRRPLDAHPDFYALWADGDALGESASRLYFCNRSGDVYRLPVHMTADKAKPLLIRP